MGADEASDEEAHVKLGTGYLRWKERFFDEFLPKIIQRPHGAAEVLDLAEAMQRFVGVLRPAMPEVRTRTKKCACPKCAKSIEPIHGPYVVAEYWDPTYVPKNPRSGNPRRGAWRRLTREKQSITTSMMLRAKSQALTNKGPSAGPREVPEDELPRKTMTPEQREQLRNALRT